MAAPRPSIADKRRTFRSLHASGCFVIPNPWDVGSARFLQGLGFKALATTSSGFAWSQGDADNAITRDMALAHLREMVAATDVPVNADFETGFARDAAGVGESVRLAVATGVAGLSIEDSTGDAAHRCLASTRQCGACARRARRLTQLAATHCWQCGGTRAAASAMTRRSSLAWCAVLKAARSLWRCSRATLRTPLR